MTVPPAPSRMLPAIGGALLAVPIVALGVFIGVFALGPSSADPNPLSGRTFYVDPNSSAAAAVMEAGSAPSLARLAAQPAAIWLLPERHPVGTVGSMVAAVSEAAASAGALPVFAVYGIPDRDCGQHSAGGLRPDQYLLWVQEIADALAEREAVVVLEPDSLALAAKCPDPADRVSLVRAAVELLAPSRAVIYLDGGHSNWLAPRVMADLLRDAGIDRVRGFATNVSNYNDSASERSYAEQVSTLTGGAHYVVDTSRNGLGSNGEWCNPAGRALGAPSAPANGSGAHDADLWVKNPGESDGACNGGPAAGQWWGERARELAANAGW